MRRLHREVVSKQYQRFVGVFLSRVNEYLSGDAKAFEMDTPGIDAIRGSAENLSADTFYVFNSGMMLALSHSIEDLAMDEARGRLWASFQDFANFSSHREKYCSMADTINEVVVMGCGKKPAPAGGIRFLSARRESLGEYWVVLYQGPRRHLLLLGRQCNQAADVEERRFAGFFTFDPKLVESARRDIEGLLDGSETAMNLFCAMQAVDQASKHVRSTFAKEQAVLEAGLRQWRTAAGGRRNPNQILRTLGASLQRLEELKGRLSEMLDFSPG
jgi:hypothetical protein